MYLYIICGFKTMMVRPQPQEELLYVWEQSRERRKQVAMALSLHTFFFVSFTHTHTHKHTHTHTKCMYTHTPPSWTDHVFLVFTLDFQIFHLKEKCLHKIQTSCENHCSLESHLSLCFLISSSSWSGNTNVTQMLAEVTLVSEVTLYFEI